MPPRRGRGRRGGATLKKDDTPLNESFEGGNQDTEMSEPATEANGDDAGVAEPMEQDQAEPKTADQNGDAEGKPSEIDLKYPYQVKLTNLPTNRSADDLQKYIASVFKVWIPKVFVARDDNECLVICPNTKEEQLTLTRLMNNHVWRRKILRASIWLPLENRKRKREDEEDDSEQKKNKTEDDQVLSLEQEILAETLPLLKLSYEEQNRLTHLEACLLSNRLHGYLCQKNPGLSGWAEKMCNDLGGTIFVVEPMKICSSLTGYRNKSKFRVGKNIDGETTVGLCLNDNESKILEVQPGDKLIHLPDIMKYAAKKFQAFVQASGKDAYEKKKKTGVWDNLMIRVTQEKSLVLIALVNFNGLDEKVSTQLKEDFKTFFTTGDGADCNVVSIFFQTLTEHHALPSVDKMELVWGIRDYVETICGVKFFVTPSSILSFTPCSSANVYNSVLELADPTPDSVMIDVCAGSCGISFTFANKCEKVFAIEPQEENVRDAKRSLELNEFKNLEIFKGKCEDHLDKIFESVKDKKVIVVLDPPRHGVGSKIVASIRAQPNVTKVVYVCSNSKIGVKNFMDFGAAEGKDAQSGMDFVGLPFLPTRAIPIDLAPYTIHNIVSVLLERVDPTTFPAATKPPPEPYRRELPKKKHQHIKRRRPLARGGLRGVRSGGVRGVRGRGGPARYQSNSFMRAPFAAAPPLMGRNMGPPRMMRGSSSRSGNRYSEQSTLITKYERRIAELEQQDRAFKAGLSMGLQALNRGGGMSGGSNFNSNSNPRNMGDYATGDAFGGYRGGYKDPYGESSNSVWLSGSAPYNRMSSGSNNSSYSNASYNNSYGGTFSRDESFDSFGSNQGRGNALASSRFVGIGGANSGRNSSGRGGGGGFGGGRGFSRGNGGRRGSGGGGGGRSRR